MSKMTVAGDSGDIIRAFEGIGELGPDIAKICSPYTHKLLNLMLYYDEFLPIEPKTLTMKIDGKTETVTVQCGDIINCPILRKVINRSFWFEFNQTMRERLPEMKMMMIAAAVERSLKVEERRELSKREKEINAYLKDNYDTSLKDIIKALDEETVDEE